MENKIHFGYILGVIFCIIPPLFPVINRELHHNVLIFNSLQMTLLTDSPVTSSVNLHLSSVIFLIIAPVIFHENLNCLLKQYRILFVCSNNKLPLTNNN